MLEGKMKFRMNTFTLKLIAIVTMVMDHIGFALLPQYTMLRVIGRISYPIFAYLLVEGFIHTHDVKKYMIRVGVFGIIAEIPFNLFLTGKPLSFAYQNVLFTFLLGLIMLYLIQQVSNWLGMTVIIIITLLLSEFLNSDYGYCGLLMILCFYIYRTNILAKVLGISAVNLLFMDEIQIYAPLALIPILLHDGKRGPKVKWLFYGFYPVHLIIIYFIRIIL